MVPLVYNITNSVVQDFTANALLALGASPIMSDSVEEAAELMDASNVLNINIGTPNENSIAAMFEANKTAHKLGRPVTLDPVAVGATRLRRKLIEDLLLCDEIFKIQGRDTLLPHALAQLIRPYGNQVIRILVREGTKQNGAHNTENGSVGTDSQAKSEEGNRCGTRAL